MINRKSHTPLYIQLADTLREQIRSGDIQPGSKLPSETEMIRQYNLGRLTIREALSILANEGLIEKHHGKGTFCKTNALPTKYKIDVLLNLTDIYFIPHYLQSICSVLEQNNAGVILRDTKNNVDNICGLLEKILAEGSDGILIQPSPDALCPPEKLVQLFQKLIAAGIPYIMIDSAYTSVPHSYAIMDEFNAGVLAANHFTELGHKSLCMIAIKGYADSELRMEGFAKSLNIPPYRIDYSADLYGSISAMRKERPDITGLFCHNDEIARECYEILGQLSLSVPDDISIISVDDTVIASTLTPPLTSIVHPKGLLGKASAQALIAIISGDARWPYRKVFEPTLSVRNSCRVLTCSAESPQTSES